MRFMALLVHAALRDLGPARRCILHMQPRVARRASALVVDPVAKQNGKEKGLSADFDVAAHLNENRRGGEDEPFERTRRSCERTQDSESNEHPRHEQPTMLAPEKLVAKWVEDGGEEQPTKDLQLWAKINDRIGR
jgi:hypothetical protein